MLPKNNNILQLIGQIQKENLLIKLVQQINKDANLVGLDFYLSENSTPQNILFNLQKLLIDLINNNFSDYINLLYRVDIPEKEIIKLQSLEMGVLTEKVAILILRKEWQKVWLKSKHQ
ncbi:MAG: hypothetical protein GQ552_04585 [Flavobacteriaceae bacterium]|nr:hypothetical protein [Flavobacteriaceae bacterium]